jgi:gluconolactonase
MRKRRDRLVTQSVTEFSWKEDYMAKLNGLETLVSGYGLIEGPRVDSEEGLYFSDVTRGGVYRRSPAGVITTVVPKRRGVGGIALHAEGGIVISGRNICHVREGETRIVFDLEDVPGFNDLFTDAQGRVFVGTMRSDPFKIEGERETGELLRIDGEGQATRLYGGVALSNGIGFSPDGERLYHSDTAHDEIIVHDLDADGGCLNRRVFAKPRRPDGLAVDEAGGVWVASYGGGRICRFEADGTASLEVELPARNVTSLCFGGPDLRDLYIATAGDTSGEGPGGSIFRTRAEVAGLPAPLARI